MLPPSWRSRRAPGDPAPRRAVHLAILLSILGATAMPAQPDPAGRPGRPAPVERARLELAGWDGTPKAGAVARLAAELRIEPEWHVNAPVPTLDFLIPTTLDAVEPPGWPAETVLWPPSVRRTFAFSPDQPLDVFEGTVPILIEVPVPATARGTIEIPVRVRYQACSDRVCLPPVTTQQVARLELGGAGDGAGGQAGAGRGLLGVLGLGLLGGLLLNAMPCVLPVLSLKLFGLVRAAGLGRREIARGALATSAGIFASFWALAAAAVAARGAGAAVGWGVQFQEPRFVAFLAVTVVLFCLNLWGMFEIQLPGRWSRGLDARQARGGESTAGHFASGLFATLMATPCSAPFLGTALAFALARPPLAVFLTMTAIGAGMSLPYLVLAAVPAAARHLPRPGAWMDTLKGALGFLLAGAAVWLFYVLSGQIAPEILAGVQLLILALALLLWLRSRARPEARARRAALAAAALAVAVLAVLAARRDAPAAAAGPAQDGIAPAAGAKPLRQGVLPWVPFAEEQAVRLAAGGSTVFVDVTADWCFTCKVNERAVLETAAVAEAFRRHGVVAMKADWTNRDDRIAAYLERHGRAGIPFYAVYRPGEPVRVLPELLTRDLVVSAVTPAVFAPSAAASRAP